MSYWSKFSRLFQVDDSIMDEDFSLRGNEQKEADQYNEDDQANSHETGEGNREDTRDQSDKRNKEDTKDDSRDLKNKIKMIKPKKIGAYKKRIPYYEIHHPQPSQKKADQEKPVPKKISDSLDENRRMVKRIFSMPKNADVIIRDFTISCTMAIPAFAVFLEGMSDKSIINSNVLEPLMILASLPPDTVIKDRLKTVKEKLLPGNQAMEYDLWEDIRKNILSGSTAVFVEGADKALIIETKGWQQRGVGETKTETVVRGPHDAFTENLRANTGLIRARLRTEKLITEMLQVGKLAPTDVAVMYVNELVNPRLVKEVKRRINAIQVDFLQDSGVLEQFIEDPPAGMLPKTMATERPDRVAAALAEGFVAIIVGQSPYVLVVPTVIWSFLHTAEDTYLRYPFGTFIRLIRFVAVVLALLLPAMYIAVTNYHPEMIPTDLMLAIAAARERVPFPVVIEVLLMELALELIREAGIRIPNVIGPTIGIVGALILGQAAVQAGIISPLLVIVVAVTALSAFTVPNYNFGFAIRSLRFAYIMLAAMWGFYGIMLGIMVLLMHIAGLKSFGVPMLSPVAPNKPSSPDVILHGPVYKQERRPGFLYTQRTARQNHFTRTWDAGVHDSKEAKRGNRRSADPGGEKHD